MSSMCNDELVAAFAGGELSGPEAEALKHHLEKCESCRALAGELRGLREGLAGLTDEVDESDAALVRERVLAEIRPRSWWRWAAVAAAVLVAVWTASLLRLDTAEVRELQVADVWPMLASPTAPEVRKAPRRPEPAVRAQRQQLGAPAVAPPKPEVARRQTPKSEMVEPGVVRMETEDPNVVIYWIFEGAGD